MDIQKIAELINIINREKSTSNILFTNDKRGMEVKNLFIEHSYAVLNLAKMLSQYNINLEIDVPTFDTRAREEIITNMIDDIAYYNDLLREEEQDLKEPLIKLIKIKCEVIKSLVNQQRNEVNLTLDELLNYNGSNGKPAYVAIDGIIYDVTNSKSWIDGVHFGLIAGRDLTDEINSCHPNKEEILSKLIPVGKIKK
ncbi:cytochrome b5 domain-containing protein [Thermobrachium celere]|uniref:Cytochrome b5 heme-binding domain-containing protein n=1 Tax=Thermobrachium celere DSM 8682 TaxID=941824 RepID=R7RNM1_9CLOT|nr:cytochrome b5 domain-containing protein [Thermobrachium celere]GFR34963.1 hypothetical protein TCEA9_07750 [Thermobrachium celere]CDF57792.1 hypothetical protein TCEL_01706 [Thermobrachium celere DSM 8682]